jgi:hypothetical protein
MARVTDTLLFGPRLALAVGGGVMRRLPSVASGSYRLATQMLGRGRSEPDERGPAGMANVPVTPASEADTDVPEVRSTVPQKIGGGFPEPPGKDPGDISDDPSPHHALTNPVGDPDPTEWPDPYEQRDDPRDPPDPDGAPFGEEAHPQVGAGSTSQPHPDADIEAGETNPPERDRIDD